MTTFIIHLENADQEIAVRLFLDAHHVSYEATGEMDETAYLTSSTNMIKRLNEAKAQKERNEGVKIILDNI